MNGFGFEVNYLDLFLSFLSVVLAVFAGVVRAKHRRLSKEFDAVLEEKGRLVAKHDALSKEHAQLGLNFRDLSDDRGRLAAELKSANEARDRVGHELRDVTAARDKLSSVCRAVADGIGAHKSGPSVANAIRAAAKRTGVLEDFDAFFPRASGSTPVTGSK